MPCVSFTDSVQPLDPLDLNSYCPISNLTCVSPILEHVIGSRIAGHAVSYGLFLSVQSAYCTHRSIETALFKIHSDLVGSVDRGQVHCLTCPRHFIPSITDTFGCASKTYCCYHCGIGMVRVVPF